MSNSKKMRDDASYERVKRRDPDLYRQICAFASLVGTEDDLSPATRYEIERYCMGLYEQMTEERAQLYKAAEKCLGSHRALESSLAAVTKERDQHRAAWKANDEMVAEYRTVMMRQTKELAYAKALLVLAYEVIRESQQQFGRHSGHWDKTGGSGTGCPVCIEQRAVFDKFRPVVGTIVTFAIPERHITEADLDAARQVVEKGL